MHEPKPPDDPDSPFAFTMEGYHGQPPSALIPRFWAPGWNSVQAVNKFQDEVGGPLRGGDPGRRLIEPSAGTPPPYFDRVPPAFEPHADEWLSVPLHHIFGSEELSVLAPGIAERMPHLIRRAQAGRSRSARASRTATRCGRPVGDESHRLVVHAAAVAARRASPACSVGLPSAAVAPDCPREARIRKARGRRDERIRCARSLVIIVVLIGLLTVAALLIWIERRLLALVAGPLRPEPGRPVRRLPDRSPTRSRC